MRDCIPLLLTAAVLVTGCDVGVPTAPSSTVLLISAEPEIITVNGSAIIEVLARDSATAVPAQNGTEIRFSTSLGRIDDVSLTNTAGVARATLQADGLAGVATVTATSGAAASVSVTVNIGPPTPSFTCIANELTVIFTDTTTGATRRRWDFGDGGSATARETTHTYQAAGNYLVTLTAGNDGGEATLSKFATVPVTSGNNACP